MPRAPDRRRSRGIAKPPLPKPRVAPYALGEAASRTIGGSTSRVGMDFSIPVAQTASLFGTLHPDYSNVELDQQSISPTVYQRTYSEVRPFFTQAASYYNDFNCSVCSSFRTTLYTPGIPTPAQGYAFEGREGEFGLAAFDAIGDNRTDAAAALDYTSPDTLWSGAFQRVITELPGASRRNEPSRRELVERQVPELVRERRPRVGNARERSRRRPAGSAPAAAGAINISRSTDRSPKLEANSIR